jgi:hypothetical protein
LKTGLILFLSSIAAIVLGCLFQLRVFPFLRPDAFLSGGKLVSAAEFATFASRIFFGLSAILFLCALVALVAKRRGRSRDDS